MAAKRPPVAINPNIPVPVQRDLRKIANYAFDAQDNADKALAELPNKLSRSEEDLLSVSKFVSQQVQANGKYPINLTGLQLTEATTRNPGAVTPDGKTIFINKGVISVPTATDSSLGLVEPDGTTITITGGGVISAPAGAVLSAAAIAAVNYAAGSGTANAQTASYAPAIASLIPGLVCWWAPIANNTSSTPTFAPNGLTAKTIVKAAGAPLAAGDLNSAAVAVAIYDGTSWELQNPQTGSGGGGGVTTRNIVTGSRAYNTVYQNTNTTARFVSISTVSPSGAAINYTVQSDSSATPTTVILAVSQFEPIVTIDQQLFFIVLPGDYYRVNPATGSGIAYWVEWN